MTAGNDSHGDLQTYRYALTISDGPRSTHEDSLTRHRSLASAQPSQMTHSVRFGSLCSKASAVEAAISHDGASRSMRSALTSVGREKDEEGARASAAPSSVARKSSRGEGAIAMVRGSKRRTEDPSLASSGTASDSVPLAARQSRRQSVAATAEEPSPSAAVIESIAQRRQRQRSATATAEVEPARGKRPAAPAPAEHAEAPPARRERSLRSVVKEASAVAGGMPQLVPEAGKRLPVA